MDALSSAYGVLLLYEDAYLLRPHHLSHRASKAFSNFRHRFRLVEEPPETFELVLVDSHNYERYLQNWGDRIKEVYIYDHHPGAPQGFKGKVEPVGSCTTLLVEELTRQGVEVDPESATLLALGIYEDTGMLTYEGTTYRDAQAVVWLLQRGLQLETLRRLLGEDIEKEDIDLLSKQMTSLENLFVEGKRVSIAVLKSEEYRPDLLSLLYQLKEIRGACAFFAIVEASGKTYLFGRSTKGEMDVGRVLQEFGGGGHEYAGAVKLESVSGDRLKEMLKLMLRGERVPLRVREVMSHPPFVLPQDMEAQSALLELSSRGFAGAPVVDAERRLVGVVYKKSLLRAQKHRVEGKVRDFMLEEFHALEPEEFIWKAEEVLSRYGEKLIPVVEQGRPVGVITRLDLMQTYREHLRELKASEKRIDVPLSMRGLLELIGKQASSMGYRVHLVGGVVRDLLMRKSIWDLDLVVEGDALALARRLSELFGVEVHAFEDFGTAHLKVQNTKLELATTRRETYPHPGAYPVVERASLKEDLLRRDFTINAMALSINPEDFGTLIDYFGGLKDLKEGLLRVLHPMSFVEDPVRILRALRFAGRFGFRLSKNTEKLLRKAVELQLLKQAPRGRLLNELRLSLREEKLTDIIELYKKYNVLEQVIEGFTFSPKLDAQLEKLREVLSWHRIEFPQESLDYGWVFLLLLLKDVQKGEEFLREMSAPGWVVETYALIKEKFHELLSALQRAEKNSEVYTVLKGKPVALLLLLMLHHRDKVRLYMEKLRQVKVDAGQFQGLRGKELGQAIEREKLKLMDSLLL